MPSFSRALPNPSDGEALALAWLAGLLEAEGSFLKPVPSKPNLPSIVCQMTDQDVVERVATMFGTGVFAVERGNYRTLYVTRIRGSGAVLLMRELAPTMGARRRAAIAAAIDAYVPPSRKLDHSAAEEVRAARSEDETVSALARAFSVSRPTIRQVIEGSIYAAPPATPWRGVQLAAGAPDRQRGFSPSGVSI